MSEKREKMKAMLIKCKRITGGCLVLLCLVYSVAGKASKCPIIYDLVTDITSSTSATYTFRQKVIDIGPVADQPLPRGTLAGLGHRHGATPGGPDVVVFEPETVIVGTELTLGQAAMSAYHGLKHGENIEKILHDGAENGSECVGYVASPNGKRASWSGVIYPPGGCIYAPPGKDWCSVMTPTVTLDHGTVSISAQGSQSTVREDMTVNCTAPMKVRLTLGKDVLHLADGVESKLKVDHDFDTPLPAGNSAISVESTLTVDASATPGDLQASTVAYIEYY